MIQVDDEVVEILFKEIRTLREVGSELDNALRYGGEGARAYALALWEQTHRGAGK